MQFGRQVETWTVQQLLRNIQEILTATAMENGKCLCASVQCSYELAGCQESPTAVLHCCWCENRSEHFMNFDTAAPASIKTVQQLRSFHVKILTASLIYWPHRISLIYWPHRISLHVSTLHLSIALQVQKVLAVVTLGVLCIICCVRLSDKACVQDREEVDENKGEEMGGQEGKIRRRQDR